MISANKNENSEIITKNRNEYCENKQIIFLKWQKILTYAIYYNTINVLNKTLRTKKDKLQLKLK